MTAWTVNDTRLLELDEDEVQRGLEGGERVLAEPQGGAAGGWQSWCTRHRTRAFGRSRKSG